MKARGSKGPEAIAPLDEDRSLKAGLALMAALRNDWGVAYCRMAELSDDDLETLESVAKRLAARTWRIRFRRNSRADSTIGVGVDELLNEDGPYDPDF